MSLIRYRDPVTNEWRELSAIKGEPGATGPQGVPGQDGHTPSITASKSGTVTTVKVDGVTVATISDGATGPAGPQGDPGTVSTTQTVSLTVAGWTQSGTRFAQTKSVSGITASTPVVIVDVALSGTDLDADSASLEAWALVSAQNVAQGAGTLTFYASTKPSVNISVNVGVV